MSSPAGRSRRVLAGLVAAVLVPVLAAALLWQWQARELATTERERAEDRAVVDAATRHTLAWASVDHRKVDEYVETVTAGATGPFLDQFQATESALRTLLKQNRSVQVPTIPAGGAGLVERRGDEARVLVAMDATVANTSTKKPRPRQYRLQVTLSQVDGEWLVSGLEFVDGTA